MVYLSGGLAHQDTFDLKPNAPAEVRGEFKPIATERPRHSDRRIAAAPGAAAWTSSCCSVRIVGLHDEHSSFQNMTGYGMNVTQREGKPHFGSVIAKVQGPADPVVPPFVDLFPTMQHKPYNSPDAGFLGRAASPVKLDGDDLAAMKLQAHHRRPNSPTAAELLEQVDQFRAPPTARPHRHGHLLPAGLRRADLAASWSRRWT